MSDTSIPVGAIVAYCGPVVTADDKQNLMNLGWLPCDGAAYSKREYPGLALSIGIAFGGTGGASGSFNVPDARGMFLRGAAHGTSNDPDAATRVPSNSGGAAGDAVGSKQPAATALPRTPFQTATAGRHAHDIPHGPNNNNAYAIAGSHYGLWNSGSVQTDAAGSHSHALTTGWDSESRPINVYVNFLIKFQDV